SDAASDPRAARFGRGFGDRDRRAVPHEPAGRLETLEGARASRAHRPRARSAMAALPARGRAASRRRELARSLPRALGAELRSTRSVPQRTESEGDTRWRKVTQHGAMPKAPPTENSSSRG